MNRFSRYSTPPHQLESNPWILTRHTEQIPHLELLHHAGFSLCKTNIHAHILYFP